jgi:hypothetical protein
MKVFHVVVGLVISAAMGPLVAAQTLGDVARQEEARRKAIKSPAKVYTNETLQDAGSPPAPVTPAAGAAPGGTPPPAATPPSPSGAPPGQQPTAAADQAPSGEATWRKRIAAARDNLARSQTFQDALQSRINALTTDFTNRSDPAQRAVIGTERQKALAELDRVKQEIQQYQKEITTIQEEARRAGVPAGWVR